MPAAFKKHKMTIFSRINITALLLGTKSLQNWKGLLSIHITY